MTTNTAWAARITELARAAALPPVVTDHLVEVSTADLKERSGVMLAAGLSAGEGAEFLAAHNYTVEHPEVLDMDGLHPHEVWTREHLPHGAQLLELVSTEILTEISAGPYQYLNRHEDTAYRQTAGHPAVTGHTATPGG